MKTLMKNSSFLTIMAFLVMWVMMSNRGGVPQAVTKAPGEASGKSCDNCHASGTDYKTAVDFTVLNLDSTNAASYFAGTKYIVKLKVSGQNNPKSYGFQMVCLNTSNNTDAGNWGTLGSKVKSVNLLSRKYLEQSSQKDDGIFYAQWTAPANVNEVKFYYAGLAANMNGNTAGDMVTTGSTAVAITAASSAGDILPLSISVFPNPTSQFINVTSDKNVPFNIFDQIGRKVASGVTNQMMDVSGLNKGKYIVTTESILGIAPTSRTFVKQ